MVTAIVILIGIIVVVAAYFRLRSSFGMRALRLAIRLPRHQAKLAAMCPEPAQVLPHASAALPLHLTEWGDAGPRVLLLHGGVQGGLGGGPATLREQKSLAEHGYRLLVPDRPGFGQSPSRGPDDMEADAAWAATFLSGGAHLIGHSFGGAVALLAASRQPSATRSLILIEPALIPLLPRSKAMRSDEAVRADFLRMGEAWLATRTPAEYGLALAKDLGVASRDAGATEQSAKPDMARAAAFGCSLLRARFASAAALREAARAVADARIPALIVTGGWSPTFDAVGQLCAELTHGRHVIVQSPNHFVQLNSQKEFNQAALEFMRQADRRWSAA